ncbi:lipase class 3 family protein [Lactarius deliciosus]|nr:lipase class 3 family protein [Lactarius deliciosus]
MASFAPFTHFASTAYCNSSTTINWSCGSNCEANPDFRSMASGGDGDGTQFWYVGFSPSQKTVVVAHQGTATNKLLPILIDIDLILESLDSPLFPGVPSSVKVHDGFASEQAKYVTRSPLSLLFRTPTTNSRSTAPKILSYVQQTLGVSVHGASSVTVVGHSLGAALSLLDGLYLRFHLNATVDVQVIGYGMPRVGNKAFADWVDAHLGGQVTHINNRRDPVPILPPRLLGFHHASGEVHITDSGTWESCPGQDNPSIGCTVGDVPNLFNSKESDHSGPYGSISMGC